MDGFQIAKDYEKGNLIGWAGYNDPKLVKESFDLLVSQGFLKPRFNLLGQTEPYRGKKRFLYHATRKVLGEDTKNYAQQIGDPFAAGTMVLMANGSEKKIEEIEPGEFVVNHKGDPVVVNRVIKRKFTGDMITIKLKGWHREVTATEIHTGFILPYSTYRFKYSGKKEVKFGDMKVGDYCLIPFGIQYEKEEVIDLAKYVYNNSKFEVTLKTIKHSGKEISRYLNIDSRFGRLLGLYLAEGGQTHKENSLGITFSFNSNETDLIQEVLTLGKELFGIDGTIQKTGIESCKRVYFGSVLIANFFKSIVPGNIYSKRIPSFIFTSLKSTRLACLRGWLDGDGFKNFKKHAVIGYTSSNDLGDDMARLALSCGIKVSSWKRFRKTRSSKENTEIGIYGTEPYKIYPEVKYKTKPKAIIQNNTPYGYARPIENISRKYVIDEDVYCITTEGEYTAIFNGIAQNQCVSFGAKNATEYLSCVQILVNGGMQFKNVFPPYYYGTGRVYVGGGRIGGDGSLGSWMASAVQKYGTLFVDDKDVPSYSGSVARKWGSSKSTLDEYLPTAKDNLVKSAALVRTWDDLVAAIVNGYPCTCASNVGFTMEANSQGFHRKRGSWPHQMCGTPYMTIDCVNPRYIKDVSIGDEIYSHNGKLLKVTDIYERDYDGKIAKIYVRGNLPLELTLNHPILVNRKTEEQEISKSENSSILMVTNKRINVWIKAGDIKEGDFVVSPITEIPESDDIPKWKNNPKCINKPEELIFDDELAWLFGLYIADGNSIKGHKVRITLGSHEKEIISKAINCISKLGLRSTITPIKNKNAIRINIYSSIVADSFIEWFGKKENKCIPNWLFNKKWNLKELLDGIFCGDGNFIEKSPNTKRIVNTSKVLINQIKNILLNLGYQPNISKRNHKSDYAKNWKDIYIIEWTENSKKQQYNWWNNRELLKKVYKVEYINYIGKVYNLEVEKDHSYLMEGLAVHNCFVGVDDEYSTPYALILNSWGDSHGRLKDFETSENLPVGILRVPREDAESILRASETFAFSQFDGFPEQKLDKYLFNVF